MINANGGSSSDSAGSYVGAGAGGTIFIGVNQITGNGSIYANGGDSSV